MLILLADVLVLVDPWFAQPDIRRPAAAAMAKLVRTFFLSMDLPLE
jgi:hypothetical protein